MRIVKLIGVSAVAIVLSYSLFVQHPNQHKSEKVQLSTEILNSDYVYLDEIDGPVYAEPFANLVSGDYECNIDWGDTTDESSYFYEKSGYPGFGKPIFVKNIESFPAIGTKMITVSTAYGDYYYQISKCAKGILSTSGDNVIDKDSGHEIVGWNSSEETIVLFDENQHLYWFAKLTHGTEIRSRST